MFGKNYHGGESKVVKKGMGSAPATAHCAGKKKGKGKAKRGY